MEGSHEGIVVAERIALEVDDDGKVLSTHFGGRQKTIDRDQIVRTAQVGSCMVIKMMN
jgi:hypothetical protein